MGVAPTVTPVDASWSCKVGVFFVGGGVSDAPPAPEGSRLPFFHYPISSPLLRRLRNRNTHHQPLFVHTPPIHQRLPCWSLPSIQRKAKNMSSPARRSTRSSQTPRSTRSSQLRSSPAPTAGPSNATEDLTATPRQPRQTRSSQLASSPLFYGSSSPGNALPNPVSSPLRQMSNTQSTASRPNNAPSSPLRQQTGSQTDGDRTPRASGALIGGMFVVSQLSIVSRAGIDVLQSHLQFATTPAPAPDEPSTNSPIYAAKAAPCL